MSDLTELARAVGDDFVALLSPVLRDLETGEDTAHDALLIRATAVLGAAQYPEAFGLEARLAETAAAPAAAALRVRGELLDLAHQFRLIDSTVCADALRELVMAMDGARLAPQVTL